MNVLIADDDRTSRLILQKAFSSCEFVFAAANGLEAVTAFKQSYNSGVFFDLVCLDVMMPKMDGQAALREIRAFEEQCGISPEKRTKIAMITAQSNKTNVLNAIRGGCDVYLLKPLSRNEVFSKLRSIGITL
jgi:two-component system chemotaxis response regulator CheY